MKISVFSAFYPFRGGISQFNTRLVKELEQDNVIECFTFKKQYPDFLFPGKTQYVDQADSSQKIIAKRIVSTFNPLTYFSAASTIKESNSKLFITNYWMTFFGPFMGLFGKKLKNKAVRIAIVHNLTPHEPRFFDRSFNQFFLKNYDGFIALSDAVKEDILRYKPDAKVLVNEHPLYDHFGKLEEREQACEKLGVSSAKKNLLFFGLIRDYKGLDLLIEAFDYLDESYNLIIAGEVYGNASYYTDKIKNSRRSEQIYFFNQYIPDQEVSTYFSAADACVLPYRSATQSGITAVAQYLETPVIVTNVGGIVESIERYKTGLIIEELNPNSIAIGIKDFFENYDLNSSSTSFQKLKVDKSWSTFAQKLLAFAKELDS